MPLGGRGGQHLEVRRRAIAMGGLGQPLLPLQFATVALVTHDGVLGPETVAGLERGALEHPMGWTVDIESPRRVHELPMALVVAAPEKAHARELVLRTLDQMVTPQGGERGLAAPGHEHRILLDVLFPARQRRAVVLGTHLPAARVAAKKSHIAAVADELLEIVPHRGRPVLVVTHAEHQLVGLENFRVRLEVAIGGVLEGVSVRLGPFNEGLFPARELRSGRTLEGHPVPLIAPATIEGIKTEPAPVVVGVVSVGGELQEDL